MPNAASPTLGHPRSMKRQRWRSACKAFHANIHLTAPMQEYVQAQIASGAYANLSEVVRAGIRLLMKRDGARQFYALKADLEAACAEAEGGAFETFDPRTFEPDAWPKQG